MPRPANSHFLIRCTHNRRVEHQATYLHEAMSQTPSVSHLILELQRHPERPARIATLTLGFTTIKIQPPRHHLNRGKLNPVRLTVVKVVEENPPAGETPVSWLLLTTIVQF